MEHWEWRGEGESPTAGLHEVLRQSFKKSHLKCPSDLLSVARDYACDGCYEPMFQGSSEFKFAYIFTLRVSHIYDNDTHVFSAET